jgi:hypothetical protein
MADDLTTTDPMIEPHPTLPPKRKYIFPMLVLAVLVGGLFIGTKLSQQQQRPTPKAVIADDAAVLSLSSPTSVTLGQVLPVTIYLSAPETVSDSTQDGVAGVKADVSYDNTKLRLVEAGIAEGLGSGWTYPIKEFAENGSTTTVYVEGAYIQGGTDGYIGSSTTSVVFATLNFETIGAGDGSLILESSSKVYAKGPLNRMVLNTDNLQGATYTVDSGQNPTATPSPTDTQGEPSATPSPTVAIGGPDPTATVTPVPPTGVPNGCGGSCGSNANCQSDLVCSNSFCRNPQCLASTSCSCSGPTATPTVRVSGPTATPRPLAATRTPAPTLRATLRTTQAPTPFVSADPSNPFLGGDKPIENIVPTVMPETAAPAVNESWWTRLIKAIIAFVKSIFGRN